MKKLLLISLLAFVSLGAYSKADDTITIPLSEADPPVYQEPCKTKWFSSNICTADGDGAFCGNDPCSNHDGNCR